MCVDTVRRGENDDDDDDDDNNNNNNVPLTTSPPSISSFLCPRLFLLSTVFLNPHHNDLFCQFLSCLAAFSFPPRGSTEEEGVRNELRQIKRYAADCRCSWSTVVNWVQAVLCGGEWCDCLTVLPHRGARSDRPAPANSQTILACALSSLPLPRTS